MFAFFIYFMFIIKRDIFLQICNKVVDNIFIFKNE